MDPAFMDAFLHPRQYYLLPAGSTYARPQPVSENPYGCAEDSYTVWQVWLYPRNESADGARRYWGMVEADTAEDVLLLWARNYKFEQFYGIFFGFERDYEKQTYTNPFGPIQVLRQRNGSTPSFKRARQPIWDLMKQQSIAAGAVVAAIENHVNAKLTTGFGLKKKIQEYCNKFRNTNVQFNSVAASLNAFDDTSTSAKIFLSGLSVSANTLRSQYEDHQNTFVSALNTLHTPISNSSKFYCTRTPKGTGIISSIETERTYEFEFCWNPTAIEVQIHISYDKTAFKTIVPASPAQIRKIESPTSISSYCIPTDLQSDVVQVEQKDKPDFKSNFYYLNVVRYNGRTWEPERLIFDGNITKIKESRAFQVHAFAQVQSREGMKYYSEDSGGGTSVEKRTDDYVCHQRDQFIATARAFQQRLKSMSSGDKSISKPEEKLIEKIKTEISKYNISKYNAHKFEGPKDILRMELVANDTNITRYANSNSNTSANSNGSLTEILLGITDVLGRINTELESKNNTTTGTGVRSKLLISEVQMINSTPNDSVSGVLNRMTDLLGRIDLAKLSSEKNVSNASNENPDVTKSKLTTEIPVINIVPQQSSTNVSMTTSNDPNLSMGAGTGLNKADRTTFQKSDGPHNIMDEFGTDDHTMTKLGFGDLPLTSTSSNNPMYGSTSGFGSMNSIPQTTRACGAGVGLGMGNTTSSASTSNVGMGFGSMSGPSQLANPDTNAGIGRFGMGARMGGFDMGSGMGGVGMGARMSGFGATNSNAGFGQSNSGFGMGGGGYGPPYGYGYGMNSTPNPYQMPYSYSGPSISSSPSTSQNDKDNEKKPSFFF